MVSVNPTVQAGRDDMPNYFKYSSPISGVEADKSTGLALATAGTSIEGLAGLIETAAKDTINKDVRKTVEPIREDFSKQLEGVRNLQSQSVVPAPVQTTAGTSTGTDVISDAPKASIPVSITSGLDKVDSIQSAFTNGKINDTYYDLRLKNAVTDLRSRYPGFVDYIDQKVSSITGINPANAYITNLMQDINHAATTKKTEYDKVVDMARKAVETGLPGAKEQYDALTSQGEGYRSKYLDWMYDTTSKRDALQQADEARKRSKGAKEDVAVSRAEDLTNYVNDSISTNFKSQSTIVGTDTPEGILDTMGKIAAHPEQYTDSQMSRLGAQLEAQKAIMLAQTTAKIREVKKDDQGKNFSYSTDIGYQESLNIVTKQINAAYDPIITALSAKNPSGFGLAAFHSNQVQAYLTRGKENLLEGDAGQWAAMVNSLREIVGDQTLSTLAPTLIKEGVDSKIAPLVKESLMRGRTQPGLDTTGKPVTAKEQMDRADKLESDGKLTSVQKSRYINNLVNIVDDITDPKMADKEKSNVVRYLFSPEGQGILSKLKTEYKDPQTGKTVPGKYSAWTRLSSDDVVASISKLPMEDRHMYLNYMEREAGGQLFQKEMLNLNHFAGVDDVHFKYNDGDGKRAPYITTVTDKGGLASPVGTAGRPSNWGLQPGQGYKEPTRNDNPSYVDQITRITNRVNDGLAGLYRVQKGLTGDGAATNEYILDFLARKSQVDLGKNWEGLPAKLVDAIAASRAPARKIEDTFKDMKK